MKVTLNKYLKSGIFILITFVLIFGTVITVRAALSLDASPGLLNSDTQINLSWTSVANAVYYGVARDGVLIANIDVDIERNYLRFEDTDLLPQTSYNYTVTAVDPNGNSIETAARSASTSQMKSPSIVSSKLDINNKEVTLTWVNNSLATRSTAVNRVGFGEVAVLDNDGTSISFIDSSLSSGVPAQYVIASQDVRGYSSTFSPSITITPIEPPSINALMQNGITTIYWGYTPNIENFVLERSKYMENAWGPWEVIKPQLTANSTSVTDQPREDGTYRYRLSINNEKYKGFSNISKPITKLLAPSNLQCVPVSPGRIDISWTNPTSENFTLRIERKTGTGSFSPVAVLDSNITSYSDTNNISLNETYFYKVVAVDANNNTASTPEYSIFTGPPSPALSLGLDITSATKITLNWQDGSNNESGFKIERKVNSDSFVEIATVPANTTTYTDNGVNNISNYTYRVIPFNPSGIASSYTKEVSCTTSIIKDPPASLTVTPVSATQIDLSWLYADYSSYSTCIERKTGIDGSWTVVKTLAAGFNSYSDMDLLPNTRYFYRVKAVLADNVYSRPYPKSAEGVGAYTKIKPPKDLKAVWSSAGLVKLTWTNESTGESKLLIERKAGNGVFLEVGSIEPDVAFWFDSGIAPDLTYVYRIKAVNSYNSSDFSNEAKVDGLRLDPPENLKSTIISTSSVSLTWNDKTNDETGFKLEKKISADGEWKEEALLKANTTSYTVKGLKIDTLYYFRVAVYKSSYNLQSYSQEIEVMMKAMTAPSDLIVKTISANQVALEWKDNSEDEEGFIIERKSSRGDFAEIGRVGRDTVKYVDTSLSAGTQYYYKVKAYSGNIYTYYTNIGITQTSLPRTFNDLTSVPWAKAAIEDLAGRDIIKGKSEQLGMFAPNDIITRAEFISLIVKAFGIDKTPVGTFTDVKPGQWYYRNVMIAKNMGIITGTGNNYFYPNQPINREDMAVILARSLKIVDRPLPHYSDTILDVYSDKSLVSPYALSSVAVLNGEKILNGKSATRLAPKDYATRAEAAVMLYKVLERF